MTRHLQKCGVPEGLAPPAARAGKSARQTFHIRVTDAYSKDYWMHLALPAKASLYELDNFLRATWLECCGHLSVFRINGRNYYSHVERGYAQLPMRASLGAVLAVGDSFSHEYDFGTTTHLALKVAGWRDPAMSTDTIELLARNDDVEVICERCKRQPATEICTECQWNGVGWMCEACAEAHDCGTEMCLPVVNSPRAGVCGYTGPARMRG
jgi:hypothetical protein